MAEHEIWIGTQGPFLVDDTDPEYSYGGQIATADHVVSAAETNLTILAKLGTMAAIADADGTLADLTTKFNLLLAELRTYGILHT